MLRLQIATGILIVLVLPTDLAYSGFNRRQELVSWIDLVLVAFIVFERRVAAVPRLQTATAGQKLAELDAVLQDFSGQEKDIWSRMILYLRALLRRVCSEKKALALKETTPMVDMIKALESANVITEEFADQLDQIGHGTFFFAWGTGTPPSEAAIAKIESAAPRLLKSWPR
jgi:hypothetical protein